MNQLKPLEDRLLVEAEAELSESGIALPEGVRRESYRVGTILDIGESVSLGGVMQENRKEWLVGKKIIFERYGPLHLKQFNERFFMVRQQYIIGIIEEEQKND